MSTKATIALVGSEGEVWHLYRELTDSDWHTHLEVPREATIGVYGDNIDIRMPSRVWQLLRKHPGVSERYLEMDAETLQREAEELADAKIREFNVNTPREEQIRDHINRYTPPTTRVVEVGSESSNSCPAPENIGDTYLVHDYPTNGRSCYGVAIPVKRPRDIYWELAMADGDYLYWEVPRGMWSVDRRIELVHRNPLPASHPDTEPVDRRLIREVLP